MVHRIFSALYPQYSQSQHRNKLGLGLGLLSCTVLACNAAGALHVGLIGLLGLFFLFLLLGLIGCYWYMASVHLLAQWLGDPSPSQSNPQPWLYSLEGLSPLLLLGPAVSAQRWWPAFGLLFTLTVLITTGITLILSIRQAYGLSLFQSGFCFATTLMLSALAILGLLGWPIMLFLGTKNIGFALVACSEVAVMLKIA